MPFVTLPTTSGLVDFHYEIATPKNHSAHAIDPDLQTIFLVHAGYGGQEIFEPQFADPRLREFNLVAVDMRGYGETRGKIGDTQYTPQESAQDVYNVMKALALPPLHILAVSIGTTVALELASRHPEHVLSMTLCSPLTPVEPDYIRAGRLEVHDCWVQAHRLTEDGNLPDVVTEEDREALHDAIVGATQLLFNNEKTQMIESITSFALERAEHNWTGSSAHLNESYKAVVGWYLERKPVSDEQLSKISCPISIVHFQDDIAYSLENARNLAKQLQSHDVPTVLVHNVRGAHLGTVTNPSAVNDILRSTVIAAEPRMNTRSRNKGKGKLQPMRTPFTDLLASHGYNPFGSEDSDESDY